MQVAKMEQQLIKTTLPLMNHYYWLFGMIPILTKGLQKYAEVWKCGKEDSILFEYGKICVLLMCLSMLSKGEYKIGPIYPHTPMLKYTGYPKSLLYVLLFLLI